VDQQVMADRAALQQRLDAVLRGGGEGLVLHRADAPWAPGRSTAVLKLKPLHDAEAQVLACEAGRGRLAGLMGALRVRNVAPGDALFAGVAINTGTTNASEAWPPPSARTAIRGPVGGVVRIRACSRCAISIGLETSSAPVPSQTASRTTEEVTMDPVCDAAPRVDAAPRPTDSTTTGLPASTARAAARAKLRPSPNPSQ
jgi:hypothetical protein